MNKKVTELTEATEINSEDLLMVIQDGENKKVRASIILDNNKNIITVGLFANQTIETHGLNTLNIDKIISQLGDKFTLKDGKVYVESGINYVLVSCNIYTNLSSDRTSGSFNLCIKKNGTEVSQALNSNSVKGTNDTRTLPPKLVAVKEGDYFELEVYMCVNDVISSVQGRTFMTIQAIA